MLCSLVLLMTLLVLTLLHPYLVLLPHILNRALHLILKLIALVSFHCINYHQAPFIR